MSGSKRDIRRGDVYYASLDPAVGSEQGGTRPALVISNDLGNHHGPTVIVASITSRAGKRRLPTHVRLSGAVRGLRKDSVALLEQVRAIDRCRLREYIGTLAPHEMAAIDSALEASLGLAEQYR